MVLVSRQYKYTQNQKLNVKKADETNINYHSIYMHTFYNVHYHCIGCIAVVFMSIYNVFLFFLFLHTNKKSARKGAFSEKKIFVQSYYIFEMPPHVEIQRN